MRKKARILGIWVNTERVSFSNVPGSVTHLRAGTARVIAHTGGEPVPVLPGVEAVAATLGKQFFAESLAIMQQVGNPKGIADWDDLAKPGVGVLYPDPKTSGGARWNIGAIYGAAFIRMLPTLGVGRLIDPSPGSTCRSWQSA